MKGKTENLGNFEKTNKRTKKKKKSKTKQNIDT